MSPVELLVLVVYLLGALVVGVLLARMDGVGSDPLDFFGVGASMLLWPVGLACLPVVALWGLGWLVSRLARTIPGRNNR